MTTALETVGSGRRRGAGTPTRWPVVVAVLVAGLAVLAACWPELLAAHPPHDTEVTAAFRPPSGAHPLGTDELGRDVLARVVHGARPSLLVGVGATAVGVVGGIVVGLLAATGGRGVDQVLMRTLEVLLAFPELLLALLVVTVVGSGTTNVLLAIGVAAVPSYARLVRAQALVALGSGYAEAAVLLGVPRPLVVLRHVLPGLLGPLWVLATIGTGTAIISGSALSFLGLGPAPPTAEWGTMLADGREFLATSWWVGVFPGLAVVVVVLTLSVLGHRLRDHADGRSAR